MIRLPNQPPEYLNHSLAGLQVVRDELLDRMDCCTLCPHNCRVNRKEGKKGYCQAPNHIVLGSFARHEGEEPPISGIHGSGTVFYSYCTLTCQYCQNYPLSQLHHGNKYTPEELSSVFLKLQDMGCHNINWVSPTQFLPYIVDALLLAREKGLHVPIVYNTSGWENEWVCHLLSNFVDVYLPDARYSKNETAVKYSHAPQYVEINQKTLQIMRSNQPKELFFEEILVKGLIVRVLILPNHAKETIQVLKNLQRDLGSETYISLMSQYFPCWHALSDESLNRSIKEEEYNEVSEVMDHLGFTNGWVQGFESNE